MSWSPEDLENPYNFQTGGAIPKYEVQSRCFDEGADAMLKALIKNNQLDHIDVKGIKSKVVFIPDDEVTDV